MKKKILIIGAGIAGHVAYNALRDHDLTVIEASPEPEGNVQFHSAVMRFRDPNTAMSLGIEAKEIIVRKEIFFEDKLTVCPSIRMNNLYSLKLYGELGRRSLHNLGDEKRWISVSRGLPKIPGTKWNSTFLGIAGIGNAYFMTAAVGDPDPALPQLVEYDYIVSTIPMPVAVKIIGIPPHLRDISNAFSCRAVNVMSIKLKVKCSVNQTVYFPDPSTPVYRATLEENTLKIEYIDDPKEFPEFSGTEKRETISQILFGVFGIPMEYWGDVLWR